MHRSLGSPPPFAKGMAGRGQGWGALVLGVTAAEQIKRAPHLAPPPPPRGRAPPASPCPPRPAPPRPPPAPAPVRAGGPPRARGAAGGRPPFSGGGISKC